MVHFVLLHQHDTSVKVPEMLLVSKKFSFGFNCKRFKFEQKKTTGFGSSITKIKEPETKCWLLNFHLFLTEMMFGGSNLTKGCLT